MSYIQGIERNQSLLFPELVSRSQIPFGNVDDAKLWFIVIIREVELRLHCVPNGTLGTR